MRNFRPTSDMLNAVKAVLIAKVYADGIRPIVQANQSKVLLENDFRISEAWRNHRSLREVNLPEFVREEKIAYLMAEDDLKIYLQKVYDLNKASGLDVNDPTFCPLLVAESMYRDAVRLLLEVMEPITKLPVVRIPWNKTDSLVQLMLNLIVPFIDKKDLAI